MGNKCQDGKISSNSVLENIYFNLLKVTNPYFAAAQYFIEYFCILNAVE